MGIYWRYFRDTLRWPLLLAPGPLAALVEGAASALDAARQLILDLRDQFYPARCEVELLPQHAKSRGIVRFVVEPEAVYQERVRNAWLWWRKAGRAAALEDLLKSLYGFASVTVINLRAADPARWAEFTVEIISADPEPLDEVNLTRLINEFKPARSKLAGIIRTGPQLLVRSGTLRSGKMIAIPGGLWS